MATRRQARPIEVGDAVMITDPKHPARGKTGLVVKGAHHMRFLGQDDPEPWVVVSIDQMAGHESGVHLSGVKRLSDLR